MNTMYIENMYVYNIAPVLFFRFDTQFSLDNPTADHLLSWDTHHNSSSKLLFIMYEMVIHRAETITHRTPP